MPLISIIIPCYNVEAYIDDCVYALVNQTIGLENLELIFVDDASTDGTYERLRAWEKKYPEQILIVTYAENKRQGGAKNTGMQYATAPYLGFVDADDWIEPDMYEELYQRVRQGAYDAVYCRFCRDTARPGRDRETITAVRSRPDEVYQFTRTGAFYRGEIACAGDANFGSLCTGITRRAIWTAHDIWFPEGLAYEDNYCGMLLRLYTGSMCVIDRQLYHYYTNPASTTSLRNQQYQLDRLAIEVGVLEAYKERGAFELFHDELEWNFIKKFYLNSLFIFFMRFDRVPDVYPYMREMVYTYFPDFQDNVRVKACRGRQQFLLELLAQPVVPTYADMLRIQKAYQASYAADR